MTFPKGYNTPSLKKEKINNTYKHRKEKIWTSSLEKLKSLWLKRPYPTQGFTGSKTIPFLTHGGMGLIAHSGPSIIGRLLTYEKYAMELKKKYTSNVDWYLYNLSVSKKTQGKGTAGKLLRPMLAFCDREKMVCYLETNKESNVSMYEHFGFCLKEKGLIPKSDVMHYAMTRQPL